MVVENVVRYSDEFRPDLNNFGCTSRCFVKTREAADQAIAIAERIVTAGNWQEGNDDWDEHAHFVTLQTCTYRATRRSPCRPIGQDAQDAWARRRKVIRDRIVQRNLGLACSAVSCFQASSADRDDLRSEAFLALVRAVDGFDPWRGFRFSTYAWKVITRALILETTRSVRHRRLFRVCYDTFQERPERVDRWSELWLDRLQHVLERNLAGLTDRECAVIAWRFAVNGGDNQTLSQVGSALGLSKERVRQIQDRGLSKIVNVLETDTTLD